ncbi:hypothetical protein CHM34_15420 [Paludifilum halophilum]|uniref:Uncharacterized protein n=1 Tax=Paludifilum halophilum TaxID=1642702 RepID=A0A235B2Z7_9BACL|nr:hypothetical protein CHM34_15420 [Paludifilum halophilum]
MIFFDYKPLRDEEQNPTANRNKISLDTARVFVCIKAIVDTVRFYWMLASASFTIFATELFRRFFKVHISGCIHPWIDRRGDLLKLLVKGRLATQQRSYMDRNFTGTSFGMIPF